MAFSAAEGAPGRFAGVSKLEWTAVLEDAARVGLLTGLGAGMYQIHPALPGYLAAGWHAENPDGYSPQRQACEQALCSASADFSRWLTRQVESGNAALAYADHRAAAADPRAQCSATPSTATRGAKPRVLSGRWMCTGAPAASAGKPAPGLTASWPPPQTPARTGRRQHTPAGSLWLYTTIHQATRQKDAGQPDQAGQTYRKALAYLQDQPETDWTRTNISVIYHQLGMTAQDRGRLDEADDWYRNAIQIREELG